MNHIDSPNLNEPVDCRAAGRRRGKLKIFFGAAPGVGKTYAMLDAARSRQALGAKVVVASIETHGCAETDALLQGLPVLPPRVSTIRGVAYRDLDLEALAAQAPALVLVDDLACSNGPSSLHARRWQDLLDLLQAGHDVYTTLNVQELEGMRDLVSQIADIPAANLVPDSLFDQADEVELVDLAAGDLLQRLSQGKVAPGPEFQRILPQVFTKGSLDAFRELAMRRVADRVDAQMRAFRREHAISRIWPVRERIVVGVGEGPESVQVIRAAHRTAVALGAEWIAVHVETKDRFGPELTDGRSAAQALQMADQLGGETAALTGRSVAAELQEFARSCNASRIVVGQSSRPPWARTLLGSIAGDLVRGSAGPLIEVVTTGTPESVRRPAVRAREGRDWPGYLWAAGAIAACTVVAELVGDNFTQTDIVILYLIGIVVVAATQGLGPSLVSSVLSVLAFDFFFVPPLYSLVVYGQHFLLTFFFMLFSGVGISTLTNQIRRQAFAARQRERRTAALYALNRDLSRAAISKPEIMEAAVAHIGRIMDARAAILLPDSPARMVSPDPAFPNDANARALAEWVYAHGQPAGLGTETLPNSRAFYLPLVGSRRTLGVLGIQPNRATGRAISAEQLRLLETLAGQTALAIERASLIEESQKAQVQIETERLRNSLLSSISHDLKTPLAAIAGAAGSLALAEAGPRPELVQTITEEANRLNRLINDLLDMTRLEAGALQVRKEWHPIEGIVGAALGRLGTRLSEHPVTTHIPSDLPLVPLDPVLIGQVLMNLLENAIKYTPAGSPIEISVSASESQAMIQVADRGAGIRPGDEERLFDKFYRARPDGGGVGLGLTVCRGIVQAHGGKIWAQNRDGGGAVFQFTLPIEGQPPRVDLEPESAAPDAAAGGEESDVSA